MNTFGDSQQQFALYDSQSVLIDRTRFSRNVIRDLSRVNSFYCPTGRYCFRGWILLSRLDYDKLDRYSTELRLNINNTDDITGNNVDTLKNISIVQAQCVTRGLVTDPNALYLVEITDARGILCNQWFSAPLNRKYNIRAPAYPQTFHPDSLNSGTTWTWLTMIQDIWTTMPLLGVWPGLPSSITLSGTPEGFWFIGVSAWQTLNSILDHLGLEISCDLTQDSPYTIDYEGASDTVFDALQTSYITHLEDDLEWIDIGAARVPKTITVFFRRRNSVYGTEETVRYDSFQWAMTPAYSISVSAPSLFNDAVGTHYIWSDFTIRYDMDNTPLSEDVTTATTIASERVTQYFARIYDQTLGHMIQTYTGALPFKTGPKVDGVKWWLDSTNRHGWRTQIIRGPSPPWPDIWE